MLRKLATVALCISSLTVASSDANKSTRIASRFLMASSQSHKVTHDNLGFKVNGQRVHQYDVDPSLRRTAAVNSFLKSGRSKIGVTHVGNDYAITRHDQLKGGGPVTAVIAYWVSKTFFTALVVAPVTAAAATATVATAGAAAPSAAAVPVTIAGAEGMSQIIAAIISTQPWCP